MTPEELAAAFHNALETVGYNENDPDQLYVPGDVVLMYDLWTEEVEFKKKQANDDEAEYDYSADRVVRTMPTAKVLRYIEVDQRLLEDHMAPSYKASLRALAGNTTID